ncbi:uncharacterized protein ACIQIH_020123 isoform 1-T1 [Cyanocitta cristata]
MLPRCRWRRPGRAVWLRALYSYRYRADDGRDVAMAAGERLLLLRRATPDWWQVRRPRDPPWARPFFVPAAYVAEEEPGNSGTQSPETPTAPPRALGLSASQLPDGAPLPPSPCQSQQDTGVTHGRTLTHRSPEERGAAAASPGLQLPRSRAGFWGAFLTPWSWKRILQVICPPTPCSDPQDTPGPTVEGTLSLMPGARGRGELQAWHRMGWGSVRSIGDICVPSFLGSALLHGFAPHKTPRGEVWEAASQPHFPGELRMVTGRASSWRGWHEGCARRGGS